MSIKFDDKHLKSFVSEQELAYIAPQVKTAHDLLVSRTGAGSDFLGWIDLPVDYDKEEFARIKAAAAKIKNDSEIDGYETVQLYMHDVCASTARPDQQLIAFEKVMIKAGETVTVTFTVKEEMLRFYNIEHKHVSEPGVFELSTGCADNLILTKSFILK